MKVLLIISFFILGFNLSSYAQVEIDTSITLIGTNAGDREITNLGTAYDSSNITSVGLSQSNSLNYLSINSVSSDSLTAITVVPLNTYMEGARFDIRIDSSNDSSVYLNINNLGYKEIKKFGHESLSSNDLVQGLMLSVVYDGEYFQVISSLNKGCPNGFVQVHKHLCIEISENTGANYWTAAYNCKQKGAKLCSWGEWYYACQKSSLGLIGMTNNNEWLNQPINNPSQILIQGAGGCKNGSIGVADTQVLTYRCCLRK